MKQFTLIKGLSDVLDRFNIPENVTACLPHY